MFKYNKLPTTQNLKDVATLIGIGLVALFISTLFYLSAEDQAFFFKHIGEVYRATSYHEFVSVTFQAILKGIIQLISAICFLFAILLLNESITTQEYKDKIAKERTAR